jgi:hypothetical protein
LQNERCGAPSRAVLESVEEGGGTDRIAIVIDGDLDRCSSSNVPPEPVDLCDKNQMLTEISGDCVNKR